MGNSNPGGPKFGSNEYFREIAPAAVDHTQIYTKSGTPDPRPAPAKNSSHFLGFIGSAQAQQSEMARQLANQPAINAENTAATSKQDTANQWAGSLHTLISGQQEADAQSVAKQQTPPLVTGQPATPEIIANASPVSAQGVSISAPAQKMQAAGGMMPAAAKGGPPRINQAGPIPQNGMVNAVAPSQELKFGGA